MTTAMTTSESDALRALEVFVGRWIEQADVPDAPPIPMEFEWAVDGRFLLQRSAGPPSAFPNWLSVIAYDAERGYTQHYFDSRGVVRVYRMELTAESWTLLRTEADFTPLDFAQRFRATFSVDRRSIDGAWEQSHDGGATWELDFPLTFTRDD